MQRLTSLFEQAKFSRREIDVSMKQDAIGALREIRDDIGGAGVRRHLLDLIVMFFFISVIAGVRRARPARRFGT